MMIDHIRTKEKTIIWSQISLIFRNFVVFWTCITVRDNQRSFFYFIKYQTEIPRLKIKTYFMSSSSIFVQIIDFQKENQHFLTFPRIMSSSHNLMFIYAMHGIHKRSMNCKIDRHKYQIQ